jgi:hypothetical protein
MVNDEMNLLLHFQQFARYNEKIPEVALFLSPPFLVVDLPAYFP